MIICTVSEKNVLTEKFVTVVLSNFRKTRTKDRIVSYRIGYSLKKPKKKQRIKLSLYRTYFK